MSNKYWVDELSGSRRPWPRPEDLQRRRTWRRWYAVACYCHVDGPERPNPFINGERRWRLLDTKRFKTLSKVEKSHCFRRLYSPFNHDNHLVVVTQSKYLNEYITEYAINEHE